MPNAFDIAESNLRKPRNPFDVAEEKLKVGPPEPTENPFDVAEASLQPEERPKSTPLTPETPDSVEPDAPGALVEAITPALPLSARAFSPLLKTEKGKRYLGSVGAGLAGTAAGMAGAVPAATSFMGMEEGRVTKAAEKATNYLRGMARTLQPDDPSFDEKVVSGAASMAMFMVPGTGIAKGLTLAPRMGVLATKLAPAIGAGVSALFESATEAGGVFSDLRDKGVEPEEAGKAAFKDFWTNAILVGVTNKLGIFGDQGNALARALKSAPLEAIQEAGQSILASVSKGEEIDWKDVIDSAGVGAVVGGATGGIMAVGEKGAAPSGRVSAETVGNKGIEYLTSKFPVLNEALSDKAIPIKQDDLNDVLVKSTAAGEEVLLKGGTQEEANRAALESFAVESKPLIDSTLLQEPSAKPAGAKRENLPEILERFETPGLSFDESLESIEPLESEIEFTPEKKVRIKRTDIEAEAANLYERAVEEREGKFSGLERFIRSQGGIAPYQKSAETGKAEELEEYRGIPVRLRGTVPYDEMLDMAKQEGLIDPDAPYSELYEQVKGFSARGKRPRVSDFFEEARRNLEEQAMEFAIRSGETINPKLMQEYSALKRGQSQEKARAAAQRVLKSNKIDDRVFVDLVNEITVDNNAFKAGRGVDFDADQFEIRGVTNMVKKKERLGAVIELATGATEATGRHEAFHAVTNLVLNEKEKGAVLSKYKDMETAADAFGEFRSGELTGDSLIDRIFEKILQFLDRVAEYMKGNGFQTAEDVFKNIETGRYASRAARDGDLQIQYSVVRNPAVEHISSAALKAGDRIFTGTHHADAFFKAQLEGVSEDANFEDGFMTDRGRFVSRGEAMQIAEEQGQLSSQPASRMTSDDIRYSAVRKDQTETPEFKRWFGDSKVIDEKGKPLVVYHGSGIPIEEFRYDFTNQGNDQLGSGFYFTTHRAEAESYMTARKESDTPKLGGESQPTVVEAYLSIKNPLPEDKVQSITKEQVREFIKRSPIRSEALQNFAEDKVEAMREALAAYSVKDSGTTLVQALFPLANDFFPQSAHIEIFNRAVTDILGYDGVVAKGPGSKRHYVAFFPEQIKSATGNRGTFDPSDRRIQYSAVPRPTRYSEYSASRIENAPIFYSQLQRTLDTKLPAKASPEMIRNIAQGQDVKKEELEWSGLVEWLADKKDLVTKKEVLDFLAANQVQIQEVVKSDADLEKEIIEIGNKLDTQGYALVYKDPGMMPGEFEIYKSGTNDIITSDDIVPLETQELIDELDVIMAEVAKNEGRPSQTKFSRYTLPGGENYRELLLTLPEKAGVYGELPKGYRVVTNIDGARVEKQDTGEVIAKGWNSDAAVDAALKKLGEQPIFRSSHFSEPNILAHVRFNERVDANGKKVLFIEEIQSDWMQQGRDKGFAKSEHLFTPINRISMNRGPSFKTQADADAYIKENFPGREEQIMVEEADHKTEGVPDAPFKKTWHELSLKRMLRYAVDHNFDAIGWTTGEQQTQRYWGNDLVRPAVERFLGVTKPESIGKLSENIFGSKFAPLMSLDVVDGGVLASLKHDQIRTTIVSHLPIDVVDILRGKNLSPQDFFSKPDVVFDSLSSDANNKVASGFRSAIRQTGTELRAKLIGLSSAKGDIELLPALKASLLDSREVAGLLSPESLFHSESGSLPKELTSARSVTEAFPVRMGQIENAKIPSAELAQLLNAHAEIIHGREGLLQQGFEAPPGQGMKGFYDQIIPSFLNKYTKKWGGRVGTAEVETPLSGSFSHRETDYGHDVVDLDGEYILEGASDQEYENWLNKQGIKNLETKVHSLDITDSMRESVQKVGQPLYSAKIKSKFDSSGLPKGIYEENRAMAGQRSFVGDLASDAKIVLGHMADAADQYLGILSTRLKNIHPSLKRTLRKMEFDVATRSAKDLKVADAFIKKVKALPPLVQLDFDLARKNGDAPKIFEIVAKHNLGKEYYTLRNLLNDIHRRAKDVGFDIGFLQNYHPRKIKDSKGFLRSWEKDENWSIIQEAIQRKETALGRYLSDDEKASLINTLMRGYQSGQIALSETGNMKDRIIDKVDPFRNQFYYDSDAALVRYLSEVNDAISSRKFFGKGDKDLPNYDVGDSIGGYVLDLLKKGQITPTQEKELRDLLVARFIPKGPGAVTSLMKNLSYIDTMGSPISAITQIGDLAFSLYRAGPFRTVAALGKSLAGKSEITREMIGIDKIAQEFSDAKKSATALGKVFKAIGLEKMDALGKETLINSIISKYRSQAKNPNKDFMERLEAVFGHETADVIEDLKSGTVTENIKFLAFNELLDVQPVALSEMPEKYLTGGNGRIFYMLKTYQLKLFDVYRNEIFAKMRQPGIENKVEGIRRLTILSAALVAANATADEIKDLLLNRKTNLRDRTVDNLIKLAGFSKFTIYEARSAGVVSAGIKLVVPPFKLLDSLYKDFIKYDPDDASLEGNFWQGKKLETPASIPGVGKFYYWWFGKGSEKEAKKRVRDARRAQKRSQGEPGTVRPTVLKSSGLQRSRLRETVLR